MKKIARLILGSGENSADIRYATHLSTPDDFLYAEYEGRRIALLSDLEFDRASSQKKEGVEILNEKEFGRSIAEIVSALAGELHVSAFLVPGDFPLSAAEKIREKKIEVIPADTSFFPERIQKSEAEAALITLSQRAGETGFARAAEVLGESRISDQKELIWQGELLTSEILRAEVDCAMLKKGMLPTGTICAGGVQSSQPHNTGSGPLCADRPIVLDIFPRSAASGYWGDLTRTVVKGSASDVVKKAYSAVREARERAKEAIAIGKSGAEIHRLAQEILERHHFYTGEQNGVPFGFFHGLGHGVGLEIHEAPRLSPRSPAILQGGEVVTVEPGLYYREWGGIRLEDLVYLTPAGDLRVLTKAPDFLVIE